MSIPLDYLVAVNVNINITAVSIQSFQNCLMFGVFPSASKPVSWGTNNYYPYGSYAEVSADFASKITGTTLQDNRYKWLLNAAQQFFQQSPTPAVLYISRLDVGSTTYAAQLNALTDVFNNFYCFYVADKVVATDLTTADTGWYAALAAQESKSNLKIAFFDTDDLDITSGNFLYDVTNGGIGSKRAMLFAHSQNFTPVAGGTTTAVSLAAAVMGSYFSNLFVGSVGLKQVAWTQLAGTPIDTAVTKSNIGTAGAQLPNGLLGVNANVYPGFGNSNLALVQYGFMSASTPSSLYYLDDVVGADYIKVTVQADLVNFIVSRMPTGVPYNDAGIQSLVNVFKKSLQNGVTQNIIQQFTNSNISYYNYSQVTDTDKAQRKYPYLSASLQYLGRIQMLTVQVNLGL